MAQKPVPAILDLRHTPAVLVKTEMPSRPASPGKRSGFVLVILFFARRKKEILVSFLVCFFFTEVHLKKAPPTRRLLKKEISLDSYTWLKRYGPKSGGVPHSAVTPPPAAAQVQPAPSVESLLKLSRRNSFCNVPESAETWKKFIRLWPSLKRQNYGHHSSQPVSSLRPFHWK